MHKTLVALDRAVNIGVFDDTAVTLVRNKLTPSKEGSDCYYIDDAALNALAEGIDRGARAAFKADIRGRFAEMDPGAIRDLIDSHLATIPETLQSDSARANLVEPLQTIFADVPERDALIDVLLGSREQSELASYSRTLRIDSLRAVFYAYPASAAQVATLLLHNYAALALGPAVEALIRTGELAHDPVHDESESTLGRLPKELINKAIATAICDAAVRGLLLSAPSAELREIIERTFDAGYERRLFFMFAEEYRGKLGVELSHAKLIDAITTLLDDYGPGDVQLVDGHPTYRLDVSIGAGRNLVVADLAGSSDPYVVSTFSDPHVSSPFKHQTRVAKKTLEPLWNEHYVVVGSHAAKMRFEVWDKDMISADDAMGHLELGVSELAEGETTDRWYNLEGVDRGELRISIAREQLRVLRPPTKETAEA